MTSIEVVFFFFTLLPHAIWFGCCEDISFSICWLYREANPERNRIVYINGTELKPMSKVGKVSSLTLSPDVDHIMDFDFGVASDVWTITFTTSTRFTMVRGWLRPNLEIFPSTQRFLDSLGPDDVYPCENTTLYFYQNDDFFLAIGYTMRLPLKVESRSPSMLTLSWVGNGSTVNSSHTISLYHIKDKSFCLLSPHNTADNHHQFTALDSCTTYAACVEIAGSTFFTCLSTITDPDVPRNFEVQSWNSSSMRLSWDSPVNNKVSLFRLTTFYLNRTDNVKEEVELWPKGHEAEVNVPHCTQVHFGLQAVCQAGIESHYSRMILKEGDSVTSTMKTLRQTSYGPDNYTLTWEVSNPPTEQSSISIFRVYHEGALQGTTHITNYTVQGLEPCQLYEAKVEEVCGDGELMSSTIISAHTGPRGVASLQYRSDTSTAQWLPSILLPSMAFLYKLSEADGKNLLSSKVNDTTLLLPGLEEGKTYVLDVWEQCDGQWQSDSSRVYFEGRNVSSDFTARAAAPSLDQDQLDVSSMGLTMVVPWSLPDDLQDGVSSVEKIVKHRMQELLRGFDQPVRIELARFEPADEPDKTEIHFMSFDASNTEDIPVSAEAQLEYIQSLNVANVRVADGLIHWDAPDLCAASSQALCPHNSLCINTLGSYTCVCQRGFYDVSPMTGPASSSHPICNEKGLFSQCLDKLVTGGIAKPYLTSYMGGMVNVKLNNGQCSVNETETFYYFQASRKASECGTARTVNKTHIEFTNTLAVTLSTEQAITRKDLKVIWKCAYPRHYVRNTQVSMDLKWLSTMSLVEFNSSLQLGMTMTLYTNRSYTHSYRNIISLLPEDYLYFEVALQTSNSFASDVLLWVETCWATESTDPQDDVQGVFLQDGCPVDNTFVWHTANGLAQKSRFSVQMFSMPKRLPLYIHCLANICGPHENCFKHCKNRTKRSVSQRSSEGKGAAIVSAGPLVVSKRTTSGVATPYWTERMTMITIVAGSIGFVGTTILLVGAAKAIMAYYKKLRRQ